MKNTLIILLLLSAFVVQAQPTVKLGAQVGLNRANILLKSDDSPQFAEWNYRSSYLVGGTAAIHFNEEWSLQPSLLLVGRGTSFKPLLNASYSITTLEVPVLVQYQRAFFSGFEELKTYGAFGPYFANALVARVKGKDVVNEKLSLGSGEDDAFKRFDWGLMLATGMNFEFKEQLVQFQLAYSLGLKNVDPDDGFTNLHRQYRFSLIYFPF